MVLYLDKMNGGDGVKGGGVVVVVVDLVGVTVRDGTRCTSLIHVRRRIFLNPKKCFRLNVEHGAPLFV